MKKIGILLAGMLIVGTGHAETKVPFKFYDNTPALADEVNGNFDALVKSVNAIELTQKSSIGFTVRIVENEYVKTVDAAACDKSETLIGGGCACLSVNNGNLGVLFGCGPATVETEKNTYVGGCFMEALTYKADRADPRVDVYAICAKPISAPTQQQKPGAIIPSEAVEAKLSLMRAQIETQKREILEAKAALR